MKDRQEEADTPGDWLTGQRLRGQWKGGMIVALDLSVSEGSATPWMVASDSLTPT